MIIKYSAIDIAKKIQSVDPQFKMPTDEQIPIIQSPLAPAVVVAGAGSGKTETMSQRVLYLVATQSLHQINYLALPSLAKLQVSYPSESNSDYAN